MGTNATSGQFDQVEVSKNLSQLIRSNTPHYWTYMKHRADLSSLKQYLPFEGIVGGDPHMGNFTVLPLKQVGGSRQMRYVDIDFDDAGRGPFVLDIIRYLIASKSIGGLRASRAKSWIRQKRCDRSWPCLSPTMMTW